MRLYIGLRSADGLPTSPFRDIPSRVGTVHKGRANSYGIFQIKKTSETEHKTRGKQADAATGKVYFLIQNCLHLPSGPL